MHASDSNSSKLNEPTHLASDLDDLAKPAILIFIATVISGGCNFLYQFLMGKALGPASYSELAAILSIALIISIPMQTVSTMLIRYVSKLKAEGKDAEINWLVRKTLIYLSIVAVVLIVAVTLAIPLLMSFLNLGSDTALIILIIGLCVSMVFPIGIGTAQGLQRFTMVSISNIVGPLGKLVFGILFVGIGYGVAGAFGGGVLGSGLALIVAYYSIKDIFHGEKKSFDVKDLRRYLIPVTMAVFCFTVLTNVDAFLARHFLTDFDAGLYSAASNLSKLILFLPAAIGVVIFPKISAAHALGEGTYPLMKKSIIWTLAISALITAFFILFPEFVINLFYNSTYDNAASSLMVLSVTMIMFGLATLFMNYGLATDSYFLIAILAIFTVVETVLIWLWHSSPLDISISLLVSGSGICLFSWLNLELRYRAKKIR